MYFKNKLSLEGVFMNEARTKEQEQTVQKAVSCAEVRRQLLSCSAVKLMGSLRLTVMQGAQPLTDNSPPHPPSPPRPLP